MVYARPARSLPSLYWNETLTPTTPGPRKRSSQSRQSTRSPPSLAPSLAASHESEPSVHHLTNGSASHDKDNVQGSPPTGGMPGSYPDHDSESTLSAATTAISLDVPMLPLTRMSNSPVSPSTSKDDTKAYEQLTRYNHIGKHRAHTISHYAHHVKENTNHAPDMKEVTKPRRYSREPTTTRSRAYAKRPSSVKTTDDQESIQKKISNEIEGLLGQSEQPSLDLGQEVSPTLPHQKRERPGRLRVVNSSSKDSLGTEYKGAEQSPVIKKREETMKEEEGEEEEEEPDYTIKGYIPASFNWINVPPRPNPGPRKATRQSASRPSPTTLPNTTEKRDSCQSSERTVKPFANPPLPSATKSTRAHTLRQNPTPPRNVRSAQSHASIFSIISDLSSPNPPTPNNSSLNQNLHHSLTFSNFSDVILHEPLPPPSHPLPPGRTFSQLPSYNSRSTFHGSQLILPNLPPSNDRPTPYPYLQPSITGPIPYLPRLKQQKSSDEALRNDVRTWREQVAQIDRLVSAGEKILDRNGVAKTPPPLLPPSSSRAKQKQKDDNSAQNDSARRKRWSGEVDEVEDLIAREAIRQGKRVLRQREKEATKVMKRWSAVDEVHEEEVLVRNVDKRKSPGIERERYYSTVNVQPNDSASLHALPGSRERQKQHTSGSSSTPSPPLPTSKKSTRKPKPKRIIPLIARIPPNPPHQSPTRPQKYPD